MNSSRSWELKVDGAVYKELRRFPKKDKARIIRVLEDPHFSPYGGDIEKIKGEGDTWRRRTGAYRIFYEVHQSKNLIHVFRVERRTSKTY